MPGSMLGKAENFKRGRMGIRNYSRGCGLLLAFGHLGNGWRRRLHSTIHGCLHQRATRPRGLARLALDFDQGLTSKLFFLAVNSIVAFACSIFRADFLCKRFRIHRHLSSCGG